MTGNEEMKRSYVRYFPERLATLASREFIALFHSAKVSVVVRFATLISRDFNARYHRAKRPEVRTHCCAICSEKKQPVEFYHCVYAGVVTGPFVQV